MTYTADTPILGKGYVSPGDIPTGVLVGLVMGMSAVGVYEGVDHGTRPLRKGKGDAAHTA